MATVADAGVNAAASRKSVFRFLSEESAEAAAAILGGLPELEEFPLAVGEDGCGWFVECYDDGAALGVGASALRDAGLPIQTATGVAIPALDWVTETQRLLPPVRAGRFIVHGSHDRGRILSRWAIEIDAGRAFGTAHHGTTRGCLIAIDRLSRRRPASRILDLGTGSGVLAIAASKAYPGARIAAVDVDGVAVAVARANCRKNGANAVVRRGNGTTPASAQGDGPFDLVVANILARPLLILAPRLYALVAPHGHLILSGLLTSQTREVYSRYRVLGFALVRQLTLDGWSTLLLVKAGR